ncbi:ornithine carbamoyltransferase [Thermosulfuriphilus ammonigenes]|uniref:Ornithine carbamoyltransferase n=1 Tax=Thermosulfuriphilus ammonigenes TaxID=1936021 RepID=A0A6G7PWE0_9BACT|nr:ornithine carbamoyltransferase [Thermosulfuriphilus ammonigenes]MBA2847794.1 ornithine carbamoyltransferase [Thermosulfuriphilus ammonigenes]QIJ72004.1 ornithine carbamoyltransferase [Thermosulfuriphilus ammonigenes]HFB83270.1 ornithine carbamoyltransferase [Thermodesulfatator sp.]
MPRHFLRVLDLSTEEILDLLKQALQLKERSRRGIPHRPLVGKILGLIFEKPSTRTRVSFEAAMYRLGGETTFLSTRDLQLQRGEPLKDTARVLSGYLHALVIRTFGQEVVEELARWAKIPVINGLTDQHHPCQVLSDLLTVMEKKGDISCIRVAWVGDGNNVAHSWIEAAARLGFELVLACPEGFDPDPQILAEAQALAGDRIRLLRRPEEAVAGADVVNTDVWASMGQEKEADVRRKVFSPYQVNASLMAQAKKEAIFLHCLPAHRGEEVTEEVLEGPQSVVWEQAENKMWLHMALLEWLLNPENS